MFVFGCYGEKGTLIKLGKSAKAWLEGFPVKVEKSEARVQKFVHAFGRRKLGL